MPVTNLRGQYGSKYKVVDDGTDDPIREERVWCQEIRGKHGVIYPYGYDGALAVRFDSKTKPGTNTWANRLEGKSFKVVQRGNWEIVFKFDPIYIDYIAGLIIAKKRRYLTPENRAKAIAALLKSRNTRQPDFRGLV